MSRRISNTHIKILQWANEKGKFTKEEINNALPAYKELIDREIQHSKLFNSATSDNVQYYFLSFEDRFRLLDYEELQEARKSANQAKYYAIAAMGISIIIGLLQIIVDLIRC